MTGVELDGVHLERGGRAVLSIPSLRIPARRVTAVLGPNGAGKTMLLRLIAGLERPQRGRVLIDGVTADLRRRSVSYVFQEDVFLRRTLLENVMLGLTLHGGRPSDAREQTLRALRTMGIEALAGRRADRISGGEARRASLARALCLRAPVMLLDEPMSGLDGSTQGRLLDDLQRVLREAAATTVVVTHDRDEAFRLCDDVIILADGRVRAAGTKQEVATNPRHVDVAEILGHTVLDLGGRLVAIPEGALAPTGGIPLVVATVEGVSDLVHYWDVSATVGETRVHVRLPRSQVPPQSGDRIGLEAREIYQVS